MASKDDNWGLELNSSITLFDADVSTEEDRDSTKDGSKNDESCITVSSGDDSDDNEGPITVPKDITEDEEGSSIKSNEEDCSLEDNSCSSLLVADVSIKDVSGNDSEDRSDDDESCMPVFSGEI